MTDRQRLIVMRHAKAEPFAATDHERRLTDRGRASARDVGAHLREHGLTPDRVLVSSATRTRETWAGLAEELDETRTQVDVDDAWFTGSVDVVVDALRALPPGTGTALFVGHNPTAAYLCHFLDDGEGDPDAVGGLLQGFPPAAMTVFELGVPWADLAAETGRVVGYHVGHG